MRIAVVGLGLIGGSVALALRGRHDVVGYDRDDATRGAARERGLRVVDALGDVAASEAIVVATPLAAIVPTLDGLAARAGDAVLVEVGSLKRDVVAWAERAPSGTRVVGMHPMAGSTASGFAAADPELFRGRPFFVVHTARTDDRARRTARRIALDLGGLVTECDAATHDRVVALVSALPLATALALRDAIERSLPIDLDRAAGPGARDATRLAATPPDLALALLRAPGLADDLTALRAALEEIERALGDDAALRGILQRRRGA